MSRSIGALMGCIATAAAFTGCVVTVRTVGPTDAARRPVLEASMSPMDQRLGDRAAAARRSGYIPREGNVVQIQRSEVTPGTARPGQVVVARVEYLVLAPNPDQRVDLREWLAVRGVRETIFESPPRELRREQGLYRTVYQFELPNDTPPGEYTVVTVLETGNGPTARQQTARATLVVQ